MCKEPPESGGSLCIGPWDESLHRAHPIFQCIHILKIHRIRSGDFSHAGIQLHLVVGHTDIFAVVGKHFGATKSFLPIIRFTSYPPDCNALRELDAVIPKILILWKKILFRWTCGNVLPFGTQDFTTIFNHIFYGYGILEYRYAQAGNRIFAEQGLKS